MILVPVLWIAFQTQTGTQLPAPRMETRGACSPAVADVKGDVTIICHGVDPAALRRLERVPALLEQLIKEQVNSAELRARLDEIAGAMAPAPTDNFWIYIIRDNNGRLGRDAYKFSYRDVPDHPDDFRRTLLAHLTNPVSETAKVAILRWRDEQEISTTVGVKQGGNLAVMVVPESILLRFQDRHLAFTYLKSLIEDLQR